MCEKSILSMFLILIFPLISCTLDEEQTVIEMSENTLNGSRSKFFQLNNYDNALDLTGYIKLLSGKVIIQIISADSDEIFFYDVYTTNNTINIHIIDLKNQKNINMIITGENANSFSLKFTSVQKLVLDKEHPMKSNVNKLRYFYYEPTRTITSFNTTSSCGSW